MSGSSCNPTSAAILFVGDLLHPVHVLAADHVGDRDMAHGIGRCGSVPVLHTRRRPNDITRLDLPLLVALFLNPARSGCDDQNLASGMGVPSGPSARCE